MQQFREVSRTRTIYNTETHTSDFIRSEMGTSAVFSGEVLSGGDGVQLVPTSDTKQLNYLCIARITTAYA